MWERLLKHCWVILFILIIGGCSINNKMTISGYASNLRDGAVIFADDQTYYLDKMEEWDDSLTLKKIKVTGKIEKVQLAEDIFSTVPNEGETEKHIIKNFKWQVDKDRNSYFVSIKGFADNERESAVIVAGNDVYYIWGLDYWDAYLLDNKVGAKGDMHVINLDGIEVKILKNATWEPLPDVKEDSVIFFVEKKIFNE